MNELHCIGGQYCDGGGHEQYTIGYLTSTHYRQHTTNGEGAAQSSDSTRDSHCWKLYRSSKR